MSSTIRNFGSNGAASLSFEEINPDRSISVDRELWFDQDTSGRWLVCVMRPRDERHVADIGSLIVTDPRVSDFIETMARLIADPDQFTDEPRFHSPH